LQPGGYNVRAGITGSIEGTMFDEHGRFDSNRQIVWHSIDFFTYIIVQCPVMFSEDVVFCQEIFLDNIKQRGKNWNS
jgi:hypothetical protein